ncbi:D-amino-acid transaminase [Consotaella salsifontis]|uniref:Probable branched-chain-amino-acid aminotransferase n=1 Tax=Consotaella salsifontis TaxID=1365950 RepID=A0A1T4T6V6_9HYPH|nr:D-amino-acid transaminase [Consotaella salsifontis]SKA36225.1 D-alanine transaminase [Consotaella salsifontis]
MSRTVYVNGSYLPEEEATVSIFDRGFLFADAVYEVTSVVRGKLIDFDGHMARLRRSLGELALSSPVSDEEMLAIHRELVTRNDIDEGLIYLQVTRGSAGDRDFAFPPADTKPTLVLFTQAKKVIENPAAGTGLKVISIDDIRWGRCDIKTVQLLYPCLAKMAAKHAHVDDAWMVRDGLVTEGSSNNAYIVTSEGTIVTREKSQSILHGITRAATLRLAEEKGLKVEERGFSIEEAKNAREAFITSASLFVMPVVEIDGAAIGEGRPGELSRRLREIYIEDALKTAI